MGIGDEIMVAGEIKRRSRGTGARFLVIDPRNARPRWCDIWDGNPLIARPDEPHPGNEIVMGPGMRPYIQAKFLTQWFWKAYRPTPADIVLTASEEEFGKISKGKVIVAPTIKQRASPNKQWPFEYWEELVRRNPSIPWLQIGDGADSNRLPVPYLHTPSFRHAVGALKGARAAILHEGGLHHAAAAVGLKSVVIYGGFISPGCTGYDLHTNLFNSASYPLGCGFRTPCPHCNKIMRATTPEIVLTHLEKLL